MNVFVPLSSISIDGACDASCSESPLSWQRGELSGPLKVDAVGGTLVLKDAGDVVHSSTDALKRLKLATSPLQPP